VDGKVKAPPAVRRMWLVSLSFWDTSQSRPAGAPGRNLSDYNVPSAIACLAEHGKGRVKVETIDLAHASGRREIMPPICARTVSLSLTRRFDTSLDRLAVCHGAVIALHADDREMVTAVAEFGQASFTPMQRVRPRS
jgi:hypothetical protein